MRVSRGMALADSGGLRRIVPPNASTDATILIKYIWTCSCCGREHHDLPTCWSCAARDSYLSIPHTEVARRAELHDDVCRIDEQWFIRTHIEIPIIDASEPLAFSVWVSLSEASMTILIETGDDLDRARHGPFFGWLCNEIAPYPGSAGLATEVRNRPPGFVPVVDIQPSDHPLAKAQRDGVTLTRVVEIAEMLLPRH